METIINIKNENLANYVMFKLDKINNGFTEEELSKITEVVIDYNNAFDRDFYLINLLGHGSIMMSNNPEQLKNIDMAGRKLPEDMYEKRLIRRK